MSDDMTNEDAVIDELLEKTAVTIDKIFNESVDRIDDRLGKGYAKDHPEILNAFMHGWTQMLSSSLNGVIIAGAINELEVDTHVHLDKDLFDKLSKNK